MAHVAADSGVVHAAHLQACVVAESQVAYALLIGVRCVGTSGDLIHKHICCASVKTLEWQL